MVSLLNSLVSRNVRCRISHWWLETVAKHAMDAASVILVLMMVAHNKWNISTMDVATALFEGISIEN